MSQIESIHPQQILAVARRQSSRSDGAISGRFVGKYGWRGQGRSVAHFVADACAIELGLSNNIHPSASARGVHFSHLPAANPQADDPADLSYVNPGLDLTDHELSKLTAYVASLPQPIEQVHSQPRSGDVRAGEALFFSIGCEVCHVADIHPVQGLFSDLLVHDMGTRLQAPDPAPIGDLAVPTVSTAQFTVVPSQRSASGAMVYGSQSQQIPKCLPLPQPAKPCFPRSETIVETPSWDSLQREWRTPPLWGVADTAPYLHDGRAATIEEAIQWHAGEAAEAALRFEQLARTQKDSVLAFLSSLRAPGQELIRQVE